MSSTVTLHARDARHLTADPGRRRFLLAGVALVLLHAFFMLFRYGHMPAAPIVPDEVIINDAAISIAHGHGYVAESLAQSKYGLDHVFAHFPPVYPYIESLAFRWMGVSVYSLRMTTTAMSILAAFLLFAVVYRFCAARWFPWSTGLVILALFCTNASLISIERMARMESTISVFTLLSMLFLAIALTQPPERRAWPWAIPASVFAAATIAIHPEALTAVILLGALLLFVVPMRAGARLATVAALVFVPTLIALAVYGRQIVFAIRQFLTIAHDSQSVNPTSLQWIRLALSDHDISAINRNSFTVTMVILLAVAPIAAWATRRNPYRSAIQRRFVLWFAIACTVDLALMLTVLRMDGRRCQFVFGLLLVGDALCIAGVRPLRRSEAWLAWIVVALQMAGATFYLWPRQSRAPEMNPDRYVELLRRIPPGVSVGASPGFWLDLKEIRRPFTLILYGLDGEQVWQKQYENPLSQFDVVLLETYYDDGRPWLENEAIDGRSVQTFRIGSHIVNMYMRPNIHLLPATPASPR